MWVPSDGPTACKTWRGDKVRELQDGATDARPRGLLTASLGAEVQAIAYMRQPSEAGIEGWDVEGSQTPRPLQGDSGRAPHPRLLSWVGASHVLRSRHLACQAWPLRPEKNILRVCITTVCVAPTISQARV